jgi:hypothetical protein
MNVGCLTQADASCPVREACGRREIRKNCGKEFERTSPSQLESVGHRSFSCRARARPPAAQLPCQRLALCRRSCFPWQEQDDCRSYEQGNSGKSQTAVEVPRSQSNCPDHVRPARIGEALRTVFPPAARTRATSSDNPHRRNRCRAATPAEFPRPIACSKGRRLPL